MRFWGSFPIGNSPRAVFLSCSLLGALANAAQIFVGADIWLLLSSRCATGLFLAGIYPVGMKIAAGWYREDLPKALGLLVGALVIGTALPHLVRGLGYALRWEGVVLSISVIAAIGGITMYALVPDGPFLAAGSKFNPKTLVAIFRSRAFRASSFGYFGHMWELYAFWAFVPPALLAYGSRSGSQFDVSVLSFAVIAAGAIGCIGGGFLALRVGSAPVAFAQLTISGLFCLVSPWLFQAEPTLFVGALVLWGIVVVGDLPQFSSLNAGYASREYVGSALTVANCIRFAVRSVASSC